MVLVLCLRCCVLNDAMYNLLTCTQYDAYQGVVAALKLKILWLLGVGIYVFQLLSWVYLYIVYLIVRYNIVMVLSIDLVSLCVYPRLYLDVLQLYLDRISAVVVLI